MDANGGDPAAPGKNVLLYSTAFDAERAEACLNLLQATPSTDYAILQVTYSGPLDRPPATMSNETDVDPKEWVMISADSDRQVTTPSADEHDSGYTVETVSGDNMTRLGMRITTWLERWDDQSHDISMCFNSLTALFQYTTRSFGLRFLDELTTKASAADAVSHYHLNPEAHDDEMREAIKARFDGVVSTDSESIETSF